MFSHQNHTYVFHVLSNYQISEYFNITLNVRFAFTNHLLNTIYRCFERTKRST